MILKFRFFLFVLIFLSIWVLNCQKESKAPQNDESNNINEINVSNNTSNTISGINTPNNSSNNINTSNKSSSTRNNVSTPNKSSSTRNNVSTPNKSSSTRNNVSTPNKSSSNLVNQQITRPEFIQMMNITAMKLAAEPSTEKRYKWDAELNAKVNKIETLKNKPKKIFFKIIKESNYNVYISDDFGNSFKKTKDTPIKTPVPVNLIEGYKNLDDISYHRHSGTSLPIGVNLHIEDLKNYLNIPISRTWYIGDFKLKENIKKIENLKTKPNKFFFKIKEYSKNIIYITEDSGQTFIKLEDIESNKDIPDNLIQEYKNLNDLHNPHIDSVEKLSYQKLEQHLQELKDKIKLGETFNEREKQALEKNINLIKTKSTTLPNKYYFLTGIGQGNVIVYRTNDKGKTFDKIHGGYPNESGFISGYTILK